MNFSLALWRIKYLGLEAKIELAEVIAERCLLLGHAALSRRIVIIDTEVNELIVDFVNDLVACAIVLLLQRPRLFLLHSCLSRIVSHVFVRILPCCGLLGARIRKQLWLAHF